MQSAIDRPYKQISSGVPRTVCYASTGPKLSQEISIMGMSRGTACAVLFYGMAMLWVWNPDQLPARNWFNGMLECAFGWCR